MSAINPGGVGLLSPPESPRNRSIGLSDMRTEARPSFQQAAMNDEFLKTESIQGTEDQYSTASSRISSPNHSDVESRAPEETTDALITKALKLFQEGKYSEVTKMSPKVEIRLLGEKKALQNEVQNLTKKIQEVDRQKDNLRLIYEQSKANLISKPFDMKPFEDALKQLIAPQLSKAESSTKKPMRTRDVEFSDSDAEGSKRPMHARDVEFSDSDVEGHRFNYDDIHYSDSDAESRRFNYDDIHYSD